MLEAVVKDSHNFLPNEVTEGVTDTFNSGAIQ
jgi:hypothetical protein